MSMPVRIGVFIIIAVSSLALLSPYFNLIMQYYMKTGHVLMEI